MRASMCNNHKHCLREEIKRYSLLLQRKMLKSIRYMHEQAIDGNQNAWINHFVTVI